jgi:hypothetical protein
MEPHLARITESGPEGNQGFDKIVSEKETLYSSGRLL